MPGPDTPPRNLTFAELSDLRRKTEVISAFLQEQLLGHLETLRPVLAPERVFGKHAGGRTDAASGDRALAQLQQAYRPFSVRPFDAPSEFDTHWLALVGTRVTLYPWEYTYEARSERESRTVAMTSPVRWVMSFSSAYTLAQFRQALTGRGERRPEHVRQFIVNALVTQLITAQTPGLVPLLTDLRYQLKTDHAADVPALPLVTITAGVPSFRPADDLILAATGFSGVPAFIELIDVEGFAGLQDPLRARIESLLT